jgi:hypothetical protein
LENDTDLGLALSLSPAALHVHIFKGSGPLIPGQKESLLVNMESIRKAISDLNGRVESIFTQLSNSEHSPSAHSPSVPSLRVLSASDLGISFLISWLRLCQKLQLNQLLCPLMCLLFNILSNCRLPLRARHLFN